MYRKQEREMIKQEQVITGLKLGATHIDGDGLYYRKIDDAWYYYSNITSEWTESFSTDEFHKTGLISLNAINTEAEDE